MTVISYYTEEELSKLKEKWHKEEERLNNLDDYWYISGGDVKEELDGVTNARLNYERKKFRQRTQYLDYPETDSKLELESTTYAVFADCTAIKVPHMVVSNSNGGKRGKCVGFSPASRLRMKKSLAKLNLKDKYSFFITLTYPEKYITDMHLSKRDLDVFRKAFAREFKSFIGGYWRLEYQQRGAPHYHMLLISEKPVSRKKIIKFIARRWPDIVRTSYLREGGNEKEYREHYEKHKKSGHNVQFMKSREMVTNYISKYISKVDNTVLPDGTGRMWGKWQFNGKKLDFAPSETGTLVKEETVLLKRMVRKHKEASNRLTLAEERQLKTGEINSLKQQKMLQKKIRQHKKDKKYAKRIAKQNTITLFGYGTESSNGAVIKKMLDASRLLYAMDLVERDCNVAGCVSTDLINPHISPSSIDRIDEKASGVGNVLGDTGHGGTDGSMASTVPRRDGLKGDERVRRRPPPVFTEEEWRKGEELQLRRVREYRERYGLSELK